MTHEPPQQRPADAIEAQLRLERAAFTLDVDLALPGRGITALFGPSGCGKTSCLRAMAELERARGRVVVNGQPWQDSPLVANVSSTASCRDLP